jgi:signal transduction histidine kinase
MRLRSQLLAATLALIVALTAASMYIVHLTVRNELQRQVSASTEASLLAFNAIRNEREQMSSRAAALIAELPILKALMSISDDRRAGPTIQDGSKPLSKLAGSDVFILTSPTGEILALHSRTGLSSQANIQARVKTAIERGTDATWWLDGQHLYWVFLKPLVIGSEEYARSAGYLVVGYEVNRNVAAELSRVIGSDVALAVNGELITSTLDATQESALRGSLQRVDGVKGDGIVDVALGDARFSAGSVVLQSDVPATVRCIVLVPLARFNGFLTLLNRILVLLAVLAILIGALVFSLIAKAITKPLENVVSAIHALSGGDFSYTVRAEGSREVVDLAQSFAAMRQKLLDYQNQQLIAERTAALGETAASISHDLRHYLAAVVANAEFLYDSEQNSPEREEIFREIKTATNQMLELIDSLRELSSEPGNISPENAEMNVIAERAMDALKASHDLRGCELTASFNGNMEGVFDPRKMERVLLNLLLNAYEATEHSDLPRVRLTIDATDTQFEIRVADNGGGVPQEIRTTLFQPFVSFGKVNGTGIGLAIVNKIASDHGAEVSVESTGPNGTVVLISMPRNVSNTKVLPVTAAAVQPH